MSPPYKKAKQKEREYQSSLAELQQQLELLRRQNETIRSNVDLESFFLFFYMTTRVQKRLQTETAHLQEEIHRRDLRLHEYNYVFLLVQQIRVTHSAASIAVFAVPSRS